MKKLLLVSIIALQGASMFAMNEHNEKLLGEAVVSYGRIMAQSVDTTTMLCLKFLMS